LQQVLQHGPEHLRSVPPGDHVAVTLHLPEAVIRDTLPPGAQEAIAVCVAKAVHRTTAA
jgi:hypothetical protein